MTENIFTPHTDAQTEPPAEPTLRRNLGLPKGVLQKNLKTLVYLGAALLVIVGSALQFIRQEDARTTGERERPAPATDVAGQHRQQRAGVEEPDSGRTSERAASKNGAAAMGDPALASTTPAQRTAAAAYGPTGVAAPCVPGQSCSQLQQGDMQMQMTPVQQQAQLIAAKERERADNSRFASNLVYSGSAVQPQQQQGQAMAAQYGPADGRLTVVSLLQKLKENRKTRPEAINVRWRPMSIQQPANPI